MSLNIASEALLHDSLLRGEPPPNLMLEVPAFMAGDPASTEPRWRRCTRAATRC